MRIAAVMDRQILTDKSSLNGDVIILSLNLLRSRAMIALMGMSLVSAHIVAVGVFFGKWYTNLPTSRESLSILSSLDEGANRQSR